MIPRDKVEALVAAHEALAEDPAAAAVWIRRDDSTVWLVEVIPSLREEDGPEEPIFFSPGVQFRFPFALIAGTRQTLETTLRSDLELARLVAGGEILLDRSGDAKALVTLASHLAAA
jgi:hypothetical protein